MTNNGKFSFLFSHSSKSRIYIKRVEVSKRLLQNTALSVAIVGCFSVLGLGILGVINLTASDSTLASAVINHSITKVSAQVSDKPNSIDYSRPASSDYAAGSGGPLSLAQMDPEDAEIERQLRTLQATSNPANVPIIWAHSGKINNEFGFRRNPFGGRTYEFHAGMDIDGERGETIIAPAGGIVIEAGWKGGYGQMIEIDHGNGLTTRYGHLSKVGVQAGETVTRGQAMGQIGSTGRSTGPHLHYELRFNDKPINPRRFLPPEPTELKGR